MGSSAFGRVSSRARSAGPSRACAVAALGGSIAFSSWCRAEETTYAGPPGEFARANGHVQHGLVRQIVFTANSRDAVFQMLGEEGWYNVCRAPCTVNAGVGALYRVSGDGVSPSRNVVVGGNENPIFLRAETGSRTGLGIGIGMTVVGGLAVLAGAVTMAKNYCFCSDPSLEQQRNTTIGAIAFAAGGGLLAGGIVLVVHSKTKLEFRSAGAAPPSIRLGRLELSPAGIRF